MIATDLEANLFGIKHIMNYRASGYLPNGVQEVSENKRCGAC